MYLFVLYRLFSMVEPRLLAPCKKSYHVSYDPLSSLMWSSRGQLNEVRFTTTFYTLDKNFVFSMNEMQLTLSRLNSIKGRRLSGDYNNLATLAYYAPLTCAYS